VFRHELNKGDEGFGSTEKDGKVLPVRDMVADLTRCFALLGDPRPGWDRRSVPGQQHQKEQQQHFLAEEARKLSTAARWRHWNCLRHTALLLLLEADAAAWASAVAAGAAALATAIAALLGLLACAARMRRERDSRPPESAAWRRGVRKGRRAASSSRNSGRALLLTGRG
jgi:hypothetical protein